MAEHKIKFFVVRKFFMVKLFFYFIQYTKEISYFQIFSKSFESVRFEELFVLQFGFFFAKNYYSNENQINNN